MEENKSSVGGILGTIIIIALIVLGGLYFWGKRIEESKNAQKLTTDNMPTVEQNATSEAAVIKSINTSDDVDSIDADLKNTKLDNLSQELDVQVQ